MTSFFRAHCTSFQIHSPLLMFFLCFFVLYLTSLMRKCSGEHPCMSSPFSIPILNGTCSQCTTITVKTFWKWSDVKLNSKEKKWHARAGCCWRCCAQWVRCCGFPALTLRRQGTKSRHRYHGPLYCSSRPLQRSPWSSSSTADQLLLS